MLIGSQYPVGRAAVEALRLGPARLGRRSKSVSVKSQELPKNVDVCIIGGGITGSALLYTLSKYTDANKLLLLERRSGFAEVASGPNNNSQTIHCGDIETNYTVAKAALVKSQANLLRNFLTKELSPSEQKLSCAKMQKMALGVGERECAFLEKRFTDFKPLFPQMEMIGKTQVATLEPSVGLGNLQTREIRRDPVVANFLPNEHSAVDYFHVSNNFVKMAEQYHGTNASATHPSSTHPSATHPSSSHPSSTHPEPRYVRAALNTEMQKIERDYTTGGWRVYTPRGVVNARFVVTSSCGYSLLTAQRLGYGRHLSCLPVAGSFYFGPRAVLKGKVYCVQNPALPFAAAHGDPDLIAPGRKTRFGPTALPLPLLERYHLATFPDFVRTIRPDWGLAKVYWDLMRNRTTRNYFLTNLMYEVPFGVNTRLFAKEVQKIVPTITHRDLTYAHGFGGIRPQVVDKEQRKLLLGEGKIDPPNDPIIFNITPSPGGTTCLGTARTDLKKIVKMLGINFNEKLYNQTLVQGLYPVEEATAK